jgi:uncharacterized protein involved in copper resistance
MRQRVALQPQNCAHAAGESRRTTDFVAGVRLWF